MDYNVPDRAQQITVNGESELNGPVVSEPVRVKCKSQSSPLLQNTRRKVFAKHKYQESGRQWRGKETDAGKAESASKEYKESIKRGVGHSPTGRSAGNAHGMKGVELQKASAHRSHCDDLTKGIYVACKYISKGVLNNRKRGNFTFMCSIIKTRSQIAKHCVETKIVLGSKEMFYNSWPERVGLCVWLSKKRSEVIFLSTSLFLARKSVIKGEKSDGRAGIWKLNEVSLNEVWGLVRLFCFDFLTGRWFYSSEQIIQRKKKKRTLCFLRAPE